MSGMREVELDDAGPSEAPVEQAVRSGGRWWWFAGGAVLAVATLLGAQAVLDTRQRAAEARFADVPGVVAPVGADVRVAWRPPDALAELVVQGVQADGAFVGLAVA